MTISRETPTVERIRVAVSVHNLSSSRESLRRAGIQRVVAEVAREVVMGTYPDVDFVPVFRLPLANPAGAPGFLPVHFNASRRVLDATCREWGVSWSDLTERWPYLKLIPEADAEDESCSAYNEAVFREIADCDVFFETALVDFRNVQWAVRRLNADVAFGLLLHDLVPAVVPEFAAASIATWYNNQFLDCLRSADFVVGNSRHTAIDSLRWGPWNETRHKGAPYHFYARLPSAHVAQDLDQGLAPHSASGDWQKFLKQAPLVRDHDVVLSVATLEPRKNLESLLLAFARARELFPDLMESVCLLLVGGSGWKDEVLQAAIERAGPSKVIAPGFVSDHVLARLYETAVALVFPSHYEGYGLPVAEAVASGLPVITAANSSLPEAAGDGGVFVRPWLTDEFACALAAQVTANRRRAQVQGAKRGRHERPDDAMRGWHDLMKDYIRVFREVANGASRSSGSAASIRSENA